MHTVFRPSNQSGVCANLQQWTTAYGARFLDSRCDRVFEPLTAAQESLLLNDAALAPDTEPGAVILLINSTEYSGLGLAGRYALATANLQAPAWRPNLWMKFPELAVHELGHGFANLHDEFPGSGLDPFFPQGPDHPEANVTNMYNGNQLPPIKWGHWFDRLEQPSILHQGGAGFATGVAHPQPDCLMRELQDRLCPVCQEETVRRMYVASGRRTYEAPFPASQTLQMLRTDVRTFRVTVSAPGGHTLEWKVDGVPVQPPVTVPELTIGGIALGLGAHTITVGIRDLSRSNPQNPSSAMVRQDPGNVLFSERVWNVTVSDPSESLRLLYALGSTGSYPGRLGTQVEPVGDLDGDGKADIGFSGLSSVFVVNAGGTILRQVTTSMLGESPPFAGLGDVDLDGVPDLVVMMPAQGSPNGHWLQVVSGATGAQLRRIDLGAPMSESSYPLSQLAALGDVDGDGRPDFALAAATAATEMNPYMRVYSGHTGQLLYAVTDASATYGFPKVASLRGDLDSDGRPDLVVAFSTTGWNGLVKFVSGATGATIATLPLGYQSVHWCSIAGVRDVDRDGLPDAVLGSPLATQSLPYQGCLRVLRGVTSGTIPVLFEAWGNVGNRYLGYSVASAGDFDMDGYWDVLVGSPANPMLGRVEVLSGRDFAPIKTFGDGASGTDTGRRSRAGSTWTMTGSRTSPSVPPAPRPAPAP